ERGLCRTPSIGIFQWKARQVMHAVCSTQGQGLPAMPPCAAWSRIAVNNGKVLSRDQTAPVQCACCGQSGLTGAATEDAVMPGGSQASGRLGRCHTARVIERLT